jgi:hypothetical protein
MSKIKINKEDKNRVLLTELLPYEVPIIFSNDGFYQLVTSKKHKDFFDNVKNLSNATSDKEGRKYGIPFNYEVRKTVQGDTRLLSIIHPLNQIDFIDFYNKYDSLILHLCSKSPFSLRRASKVAKFYYSPDLVFDEEEQKSEEVEVEPEILDNETKLLKSYFSYKPIDLVYKFYDRSEYQRLEQRFNLLMEFDISKCFYNIYTHSITWAVKDKESAKKGSKQTSFENSFDKIMQLSNYNETHGIVVGPEVSRIFAEVILQQIDLNVLRKITKEGYEIGNDFEIRRYVDDFFVFSNEKKILDSILETYRRELEEYKLYINKQKTEFKETPFITNIAVGKREIKHLLDNLFSYLIIEDEISNTDTGDTELVRHLRKLDNPLRSSQEFIKDYQCVVKRNHLTYDIISKDVIRYLKRELVKFFKDEKIDKNEKNVEGILILILDIAFYSYSLNITSSTTFKLSQMIVLICKFLTKKNEELRQTIFSKISKDSDFVISIFQQKVKIHETNIETLNLLIALKKLDKTYQLSEKKIKKLFKLDKNETFRLLNYFHLVTLLYYIEDDPQYNNLKIELEKTVVKRFMQDRDPFSKAELTLLFFDIINCPYITIPTKKRILVESNYSKKETEQNQIIANIMKQKVWFIDWDKEIDLESILKKKEWGATY